MPTSANAASNAAARAQLDAQPLTVISTVKAADGSIATLKASPTLKLKPSDAAYQQLQRTAGSDGSTQAVAARSVKAKAAGYGCYSKRVQKVSQSLGIYQWGMTLDKQWCGNTTITSQDKQCYHTEGTNWSYKSGECNTRMNSSSNGNSYFNAHFQLYYGPAFEQNAYPQIGVSFYADGRAFPYSN